MLLLATSYLPPLWYLKKIADAGEVTLECCEHFVKQSIRNRCHILSANGIQSLIIPVNHSNRFTIPVKEIRVANDMPWQRQHWRSLCSAYQRSAYFEFYQDDLAGFYHKPYEFLFDFNHDLLHFLLGQFKIKPNVKLTVEYQRAYENTVDDLRSLCDSGLPSVESPTRNYPQVFGYKDKFIPGLSAADLLFNMGPGGTDYLR